MGPQPGVNHPSARGSFTEAKIDAPKIFWQPPKPESAGKTLLLKLDDSGRFNQQIKGRANKLVVPLSAANGTKVTLKHAGAAKGQSIILPRAVGKNCVATVKYVDLGNNNFAVKVKYLENKNGVATLAKYSSAQLHDGINKIGELKTGTVKNAGQRACLLYKNGIEGYQEKKNLKYVRPRVPNNVAPILDQYNAVNASNKFFANQRREQVKQLLEQRDKALHPVLDTQDVRELGEGDSRFRKNNDWTEEQLRKKYGYIEGAVKNKENNHPVFAVKKRIYDLAEFPKLYERSPDGKQIVYNFVVKAGGKADGGKADGGGIVVGWAETAEKGRYIDDYGVKHLQLMAHNKFKKLKNKNDESVIQMIDTESAKAVYAGTLRVVDGKVEFNFDSGTFASFFGMKTDEKDQQLVKSMLEKVLDYQVSYTKQDLTSSTEAS